MAIANVNGDEMRNLLKAINAGNEVIALSFDAAVNSTPTLTIKRWATDSDLVALTEYFALYDKHPHPDYQEWAKKKANLWKTNPYNANRNR